jgi:cysteine desulfurase
MKTEMPVYLDFSASTPVDERVLEAMLPYFREQYGNSSSAHRFGQKADSAIEESRSILAQGLNCKPREVIFTSCGSESDNLAIRGVCLAMRKKQNSNHILVPPTEHPAVLRTAQQLKSDFDFDVELLPVDEYGITSARDVAERIRPTTALVSIMYANNEIGSINPIPEIGLICQEKGVPFHTDAVQAAAYLDVNVDLLHVDLLSLGAHKFYGPKGVGALFVKEGTPILPAITGGSQEFGMRAGTSNTPLIVGLAKAFELAQRERTQRVMHVKTLRNLIIAGILEKIQDSKLTGHPRMRLPNHASFAFKNVNGNDLLTLLDAQGFACSSGSACKTGSPAPSEVLKAIGLDEHWTMGSLRITVGNTSREQDVHRFLDEFPGIIARQRNLFSVFSISQ